MRSEYQKQLVVVFVGDAKQRSCTWILTSNLPKLVLWFDLSVLFFTKDWFYENQDFDFVTSSFRFLSSSIEDGCACEPTFHLPWKIFYRRCLIKIFHLVIHYQSSIEATEGQCWISRLWITVLKIVDYVLRFKCYLGLRRMIYVGRDTLFKLYKYNILGTPHTTGGYIFKTIRI